MKLFRNLVFVGIVTLSLTGRCNWYTTWRFWSSPFVVYDGETWYVILREGQIDHVCEWGAEENICTTERRSNRKMEKISLWGLQICTVTGWCGHGNEHLGSIKGEALHDQLESCSMELSSQWILRSSVCYVFIMDLNSVKALRSRCYFST